MNTTKKKEAMMPNNDYPAKDELSTNLMQIVNESKVGDTHYIIKNNKFAPARTINADLLLTGLTVYLTAREQLIFDHAYKMGQESVGKWCRRKS